jgi:hypothetical protein
VAGVVALLLEADSTLSNSQIRDLITSTAATDSQTVSVPGNNWGYGRVNAAGAVAKALNIVADTVRFFAGSDPPDTLRTGSFTYSISADFRGSIQAPSSYSLRVTWPPESMRLSQTPDSLVLGGTIRLSSHQDSLSSGVLHLTARVLATPPDSFALAELEFSPLNAEDIDGVQVSYQALALAGDLAGGDILSSLTAGQSGPLSFRLEDMCLLAGDLDNSGQRDVFDLLEILKIVSRRNEATLCSDLNGSGTTDIFDLLELLKLMKQN